MPTGQVKFYDSDKGFGFLSKDGGGEVFVNASALPDGTQLRKGQRVEFGVADSRRGETALSVRLLEPAPSVAKAMRRKPEELAPIIEDVIKYLDDIGNSYRRGRHPDNKKAATVAQVLRKLADDIEG